MAGNKGWICLYRSIQDHWLYEDKPFNYSMAWIDLIMSCNHSDNNLLFNHNLITIKRGQTLTSIRKLAEKWGWGRDKVARFLNRLVDDGMIVKKSDSHRTLLTLVNYDFFQGDVSENRTPIGHQSDTDKDTDKAQTTMNNNDSTMINKRTGRTKSFIPPTIKEVQNYCHERNNGIDASHFCDYYEARGWELTKGRKMKDWKAAVRTWEKNNGYRHREQSHQATNQRKQYSDNFTDFT